MLKSIFFGFFILVIMGQATAHEFWLEPINYKINVNDTLLAHEKVGQKFKGNTYSYLDSSYASLEISLGGKTRAVKSRLGDLPAVSEPVNEEGLAILSAVTTPSVVTYETWEKFLNFVENKGLKWVIKAHKKRNLPEKNFSESFRRYGKALVKVGHGKGQDKKLGMLFEWVLETNPYTSDAKNIKAQLFWKDKPHSFAQVTVFNNIGDDLFQTDLMTDIDGKVEIPRNKGGKFMINAVKMIEASPEITDETNAVWDSRWASITYELDAN